jgi:Enoyl-(Acyl carrier protein) reductase
MAEAVRWGKRGARINTISPGIIFTPLAKDELTGPRGEGYRRMIELCPVGRGGSPDEVGTVGALLMGSDGAFITGSDFLMDGGVTASNFFGELSPPLIDYGRCRRRRRAISRELHLPRKAAEKTSRPSVRGTAIAFGIQPSGCPPFALAERLSQAGQLAERRCASFCRPAGLRISEMRELMFRRASPRSNPAVSRCADSRAASAGSGDHA